MRINTMIAAVLMLGWFAPTFAQLPTLPSGVGDALKAKAPSLTGLLASQVGVTDKQATGGVGSILTLAKEKLAAGDFTQVASAVPGADGYIQKAKSLGAVTGRLGGMPGLNAALRRLGISPEVAAKFTPAVVNFVGSVGGEKTKALLSSVLK